MVTQANIFSLTAEQLVTVVAKIPEVENPHLRAQLLFKEIYARKGIGLENLNVAKRLHNSLLKHLSFDMPLEISAIEHSDSDGSVKLMLRLKSDGSLIETVLVPERNRLTQCISTQVGCRQGCTFCHTGRMGFTRNLTTDEIVGQVVLAEHLRIFGDEFSNSDLRKYEKISNVVHMGMGEPLDNLENVIASTHIFTHDQGLRLSPNKITVSTVGIIPELNQFLEQSRAALALSLLSPFSDERSKLIPSNRKHPLAEIIAVLKKHAVENGREYFIQYMLVQGLNDTLEHAKAISEVFAGIPIKINIIPINEHTATILSRPSVTSIFAFQQALKSFGLVATVRLSKGRDIQAACGQLVAQHQGP